MKKMQGMGGFFVAAITPFDAQGRFNPDALHRIMDKTIAQGAAGFDPNQQAQGADGNGQEYYDADYTVVDDDNNK